MCFVGFFHCISLVLNEIDLPTISYFKILNILLCEVLIPIEVKKRDICELLYKYPKAASLFYNF